MTDEVIWPCDCGLVFTYGSEWHRHLRSGACPVPRPPEPTYERIAVLRCGVPMKGRRSGGPCAQRLLELGYAGDGVLAHRNWGPRGKRVNFVKDSESAARVEQKWRLMPAEEYLQYLAKHDGEQPTERDDMGWWRHDDYLYAGPNATLWVPVVCTRHSGALVAIEYLRFIEQMQRRTVLIDVRQERHGVPSS